MMRSRYSFSGIIALISLAVLLFAVLGLTLTGYIARSDAYEKLIGQGVNISSRAIAMDTSELLGVGEHGAFSAWLARNIFACLLTAGGILVLILLILLKDVRGAGKWLSIALFVCCAVCLALTGYASAVTAHYIENCADLGLTPLEYQIQNGAFTGVAGFLNGKTTVFPYAALGCALLALCAAFKLPKRIFK